VGSRGAEIGSGTHFLKEMRMPNMTNPSSNVVTDVEPDGKVVTTALSKIQSQRLTISLNPLLYRVVKPDHLIRAVAIALVLVQCLLTCLPAGMTLCFEHDDHMTVTLADNCSCCLQELDESAAASAALADCRSCMDVAVPRQQALVPSGQNDKDFAAALPVSSGILKAALPTLSVRNRRQHYQPPWSQGPPHLAELRSVIINC
jgi:hypothetical protein